MEPSGIGRNWSWSVLRVYLMLFWQIYYLTLFFICADLDTIESPSVFSPSSISYSSISSQTLMVNPCLLCEYLFVFKESVQETLIFVCVFWCVQILIDGLSHRMRHMSFVALCLHYAEFIQVPLIVSYVDTAESQLEVWFCTHIVCTGNWVACCIKM